MMISKNDNICRTITEGRYSYIGVAISVVCAEMVITLVHYIFAMRYMKLKFHDFIPIKSIFQL